MLNNPFIRNSPSEHLAQPSLRDEAELTLADGSRFVLWPMAHSALLQELVVLGSPEPIGLPSCLTGIAGQVVGGAVWVLRQDDHRCVLPGTGPSLHPSGGRLAGSSTRNENDTGQHTCKHPMHWILLRSSSLFLLAGGTRVTPPVRRSL